MTRETDQFREGRIAGLREAVEIVSDLETKVAVKLGRVAPPITTRARLVRRQAFKTASARIGTRLRALSRRRVRAPIESMLERLGL